MPVVVVARIRKIRKQSNKIKGVIKFDEKFYVQHQRETNWENFEIQGALNERKYNKLTHERTHEHTNTCRYQHTWKIYILFYREQQQQRKLFRSEKEIIVPVRIYIHTKNIGNVEKKIFRYASFTYTTFHFWTLALNGRS